MVSSPIPAAAILDVGRLSEPTIMSTSPSDIPVERIVCGNGAAQQASLSNYVVLTYVLVKVAGTHAGRKWLCRTFCLCK